MAAPGEPPQRPPPASPTYRPSWNGHGRGRGGEREGKGRSRRDFLPLGQPLRSRNATGLINSRCQGVRIAPQLFRRLLRGKTNRGGCGQVIRWAAQDGVASAEPEEGGLLVTRAWGGGGLPPQASAGRAPHGGL